MYSDTDSSRRTMGDVDVIFVDGWYHLFHLVLPNHDYIAHAVSRDALNWERVQNALFIGHPGNWDDSMLWTMHVSLNPFWEGGKEDANENDDDNGGRRRRPGGRGSTGCFIRGCVGGTTR